MTGWVKYTAGVAGPGGTMQGTYPIFQSISVVPIPATFGLLFSALGLLGIARRHPSVA
ncbi:MAG: hypothetical protein ABL989_03700 [Gammaproteobacteria bacterium]